MVKYLYNIVSVKFASNKWLGTKKEFKHFWYNSWFNHWRISLIFSNLSHGFTVLEPFYLRGKLYCNFHFEYVYGLLCIQVLKLLKDITRLYDHSHNSFSIVWWNLFLFSCLGNDYFNKHDKQLSNSFLTFRLNEAPGLPVIEDAFNKKHVIKDALDDPPLYCIISNVW